MGASKHSRCDPTPVGSRCRRSEGSLWPYIRMCYFSAITITTLGFGDITPVTTEARVLVGTEAVLGVVIIGLFLNAVAQKWRKT
jgi:ion channel